jgi:hypothetical protein
MRELRKSYSELADEDDRPDVPNNVRGARQCGPSLVMICIMAAFITVPIASPQQIYLPVFLLPKTEPGGFRATEIYFRA